MKQFMLANWCRVITATSMLIFACGFFVFAIKHNTAKAGSTPPAVNQRLSNTWIVTMGSKFYEVTWDDYGKRYACHEICD